VDFDFVDSARFVASLKEYAAREHFDQHFEMPLLIITRAEQRGLPFSGSGRC
jgi:hypothetical protein